MQMGVKNTSNHHLLLFDYLQEGCGVVPDDNVGQYMQDHKNQKLFFWTKTKDCLPKQKRREKEEEQVGTKD
jgi:hypothetical protein